jgi:hypothetical protein
MLAILTIPVILYQLFFVLVQFIARKVSNKTAIVVLVLCLIWTATHVFLPLLATMQAATIVGSFLFFRARRKKTKQAQPK